MRTLGLLPKTNGMGTREMLSAATEGRLAALLVFEEDVAAALSGEYAVVESLKKLDLLVVHDLFLTATAKLAHVVLPGLSFYEKEGTFTNVAGRVQRLNPALEPFGDAIPLIEILQRLACRLALPLMDGNAEAVWHELVQTVPAYAGITHERIGEVGVLLTDTRATE
jgi:predicted molibdopterin-dependent oxidoreductase YjgC